MSEENHVAMGSVLLFLATELRETQRALKSIKAYLGAMAKTPEQVQKVLTLGEDSLRKNDPIEEKFRQVEAQLELLKAGKDLETADS